MCRKCPFCNQSNTSSERRKVIVLIGSFVRKSDQSKQQRYRCNSCRMTFSDASLHPCYYQKKRQFNHLIYQGLVSGVSQRRLTRVLRLNRKTIVRKLIFLSRLASNFLVLDRGLQEKSETIEFDDLETFEHSKLKPLSVIAVVESESRRVLGLSVARMPAKGLLVKQSLKKYGHRQDERKKKRQKLLKEIKPFVIAKAVIKSDENPHYVKDVRRYFPEAKHLRYKGRRGCVVGQGELKSGGFDPLFSLNHTLAMFRANVNRLFRRSWNTTKRADRLEMHLKLYALYHNSVLIYSKSV